MSADQELIATEMIVKRHPFTVRRIVKWAECDPAGVVYAGNFPEYMLSTAHLFRQHVLGAPIGKRDAEQKYGTPGKALSMVFMGPLWPGDVFDMSVHIGKLGGTTTDLLINAVRADDGSHVFVGRVTSIYVDAEDRKCTISIPQNIRDVFKKYREECGVVPAALSQVSR